MWEGNLELKKYYKEENSTKFKMIKVTGQDKRFLGSITPGFPESGV